MRSGTLAATAEARRSRTDKVDPGRAVLERAIVQTVAYADVFDYPLTAEEIHRYLIGVQANRGTVRATLNSSARLNASLTRVGKFYSLVGREAAVETRKVRGLKAAEYWRRAVRYGHVLGNLPFVKMIAVTGALAMDNLADADIDFLIVTEPGRLWLCRAMVIGLVRLAALRHVELCPNYFLSAGTLELPERNLFTAHEVAQMVPLTGSATYNRFRELNRWTQGYLPNAGGAPHRLAVVDPRAPWTRRVVETGLRTPLGGAVERWEMTRKLAKLGRQGNGHLEAAFGPDWCKGHFGDHGLQTLARYEDRLRAVEQP
ncbi:MAG TPA: hypothetical protein VGQ62_15975 [Chloroflexota bacterium]|jgi:hypothetical protein|nr:hypothetical protein [Chloroflexota bacterium]